MKFLDEAKIYMESGHGGAGCISFRREKFIDMGGPNGGNGGKGGDVIIEVVDTLNTLIDFRYTQHFKAQKGHHGMGKDRSGLGGEDVVVRVPAGTQILDEDKETVLLDLTEPGQRIVFLRGGDGGFGNAHYKTATNQAPRKSTPGWPGQEAAVWLRLKLIADAGLVGLPNAGKSTFLAASTRARPKIADYPFTTLHPNLGVAYVADQEFIIADIPGLIEGASEGMGLGTRFLGHIERTAILLHLIDATQDDIVGAYNIIRGELEAYGAGLDEKPELVALNKCDALGPELAADQARILEEAIGKKVYQISAIAGMGMKDVLYPMWNEVKHMREQRAEEAAARRKSQGYSDIPEDVPEDDLEESAG